MESLKKHMIRSYYAMPLIDSEIKQKVIIVTHSGVITGIPVTKDEPDEAINHMASVSSIFVDDYRKENSIEESASFDGNDGFLILKDVEFKLGAMTQRFNVLTVFYDQIVGITVGRSE